MHGNLGETYMMLGRMEEAIDTYHRALEPDGWRVEVLAETGSTNAVASERASAGEPHGLVVVAGEITTKARFDYKINDTVEAGLMLVAASGAAMFGLSQGIAGLTVGRALIGSAGVGSPRPRRAGSTR